MKTYVTDEVPLRLQSFVSDYSKIYQTALRETVNYRLDNPKSNKSELNTYLQGKYKINKRHANAIITEADGMIGSARECRLSHIKDLENKLKSASGWLKNKEKQLKDSKKFYQKKKWSSKKATPRLRLSCNLKKKLSTWQTYKFQIHHKKRYIIHLRRKIELLKVVPIRVGIHKQRHAYFVGSKGESWGNQVCQFDGKSLQIRVPECLEAKYGEYLTVTIKSFPYGREHIDTALNTTGLSVSRYGNVKPIQYGIAMTYRFSYKDLRWFMAVSFELHTPERVTKSRYYGCLGIDINTQSIGWAYVDNNGNLKAKGQIKFDVSNKRRGKVKAIIGETVKSVRELAVKYCCPLVCETLEFSRKKAELRERGKKYARKLSNFAYSRLIEALRSSCYKYRIELIQVNPAYSSLIGLVKYARLYGLASDQAAALTIARRAMGLSERLPHAITALIEVNSSRHVWHGWSKLNNKLSGMKRHTFYSTVSNWEPLVNPDDESEFDRLSGKWKRAKGSVSS